MTDRRFDPIGALISVTWAVLLCVLALAVVVNVLRDIWPWLLAVTLIGGGTVAAIRLALWSRSRPW